MALQNDNVNNHSVILRRKGLLSVLAIVVLIGTGIVWLTVFRGDKAAGQDVPTFTAKQGPLTISVVESGTIKARDQHIIKNEVEGRTSIISLVSEGTRVKEGDLLVELDASSLQDAKINQEISVQNTEAAYINAQENLAIVTSQAASDVNQAELDLEFAQQDLVDGFARKDTDMFAGLSRPFQYAFWIDQLRAFQEAEVRVLFRSE